MIFILCECLVYNILILYSIRAPQYPSIPAVSQSTHFERLDLLGKEHTEAGIEQAKQQQQKMKKIRSDLISRSSSTTNHPQEMPNARQMIRQKTTPRFNKLSSSNITSETETTKATAVPVVVVKVVEGTRTRT